MGREEEEGEGEGGKKTYLIFGMDSEGCVVVDEATSAKNPLRSGKSIVWVETRFVTGVFCDCPSRSHFFNGDRKDKWHSSGTTSAASSGPGGCRGYGGSRRFTDGGGNDSENGVWWVWGSKRGRDGMVLQVWRRYG